MRASGISAWLPWEETFRTEMQRLRLARGLSQTELARLVKGRGLAFHQQTVQKIEAGERTVRLDEAFVIAELLDVSLETMTTASLEPDDRDARTSVDRLRRQSAVVLEYLHEVHAEWAEVFEEVIYILERLLKEHGKDPRPIELWLTGWALKAEEVDAQVRRASLALAALAGGRNEPIDPSPAITELMEFVNRRDYYVFAPEGMTPDALKSMPVADLDRVLKEASDGEHPEAP